MLTPLRHLLVGVLALASQIPGHTASAQAVYFPPDGGPWERVDPASVGWDAEGEADRPVGMNTTWPRPTREYADLVRSWVSEVRRSIDFIESRSELDRERIAYVGASWGGRLAAIVSAVEPRLRVNIVWFGGLASGDALPEADQINYVTRITVPTLMLNGLHDPLEPLETSQLPMYRLLGTPAEHKRHVRFDDWGHGLPTNDRIRESLDFLDRYLGPVN